MFDLNRIIACTFIVLLPLLGKPGNSRIQNPNLLFVFPDQFRAQSMGFLHQDPVFTPAIDKLASQGVVFPNAVSNRPLCSPFRGMLMTGKYCFSTGLQGNCNTYSRKFQNFLKEEETCFSDVLKSVGYYCGYIGKWHLDAPTGPDADTWQTSIWDAYTPPGRKRHGFDFWHAYGCFDKHFSPHYWVNNSAKEDTLFAGKWSPEHEADIATEFILNSDKKQRPVNKPWALFVSMNPPHPPFDQVPEKYKNIYKDIPAEKLLNRPNVAQGERGGAARQNAANYFSCISGIDEQLGRILEALDSSGQAENTIVVFTSDHGEMMGSHGLMHKVVWYDESFKIPFIIRWTGRMNPGTNNLNLSVPDMMPTLLGLMGLENQITGDIEGENLAKFFLKGLSGGPEYSLYLNCQQENALGGMRGLRNEEYTFVMERDKLGNTLKYRLYNNLKDPYQLQDIASDNTEQIKRMEAKLFEKLRKINDPWIVYNPGK